MSNNPFSLDKLLIFDPSRSKSTAHVFIAHQSAVEEKTLGKLLILTEIKSRDSVNQEIIDEVQKTIKTNYYETEDLNIETAFEKALEKTNQKIADLIGLYETNWLDKLNVAVAVIKDDILYFTQVGQIYAFLIHHQTITDIIATTPGAESKTNPLKIFSNIISGNLSESDSLLFCTPSLLDYISLEKLKRIILGQNPHEAVLQIENLLAENSGFTAFAAIIVKLFSQRDYLTQPSVASTLAAPASHLAPQSSMEELIEKEASTEKYLSPSLLSYFIKSTKTLSERLITFVRLKILKQSQRRVHFQKELKDYGPAMRERKEVKKKNVITASIYLVLLLGKKIVLAILGAIRVFSRIFKKQKKMELSEKVRSFSLSSSLSNIIVKFKHLPRYSKIILAIIVIIAFLLTQGLFSLAQKKETGQKDTDYLQTVSSISQKILQAESALSYGNETGAKKLLTEAQDLLNGLPKKKEEQKQKADELQNNINAQKEKTKHITRLENPKPIADFATIDSKVNLAGLASIGKNIYAFNPADNSIYQLNLENNKLTFLAKNETENKFQYIIPETSSTLIFLNTANKLDEYNLNTKKFRSLESSLPSEDVNIADFSFYSSRIYLLDILNNQIYRSTKTSAGYGTPIHWLKDESVDLKNGKSMAIDGSLHILKSNGEVYKFSNGSKDDWRLDTIDPVLNSADHIWTDSEANNLYLLDFQGKRIVVFNKSGKFLNQYTSDRFDNLKDFVIKEKDKKAYLLNGAKVFEIDLK